MLAKNVRSYQHQKFCRCVQRCLWKGKPRFLDLGLHERIRIRLNQGLPATFTALEARSFDHLRMARTG